MPAALAHFSYDFFSGFKAFHELMSRKIREVLLISTPYDAWVMEEDGRLSEHIMHEYRGLNLSHPPRLTWVSSARDALTALQRKRFDLVITMPFPTEPDPLALGREIKQQMPNLPVVMLTQETSPEIGHGLPDDPARQIDRTFLWTGNTEILLALIKSIEDRQNADYDTEAAGVRVILFVEDSPRFLSSLLPIFYKELVTQTQAVMDHGLTEEHRLVTMRARPKILVADQYEVALQLYEKYRPYIHAVISDVRFPRNGRLDANAGVDLLTHIKKDRWDIPQLLTSSDTANGRAAKDIPATFVHKYDPQLHGEVRRFFLEELGFGDFLFRSPQGEVLTRATSLRTMEEILPNIPTDSLLWHCSRNDFSRWLFARCEIMLATRFRDAAVADFDQDVQKMRTFIVNNIRARRRMRQKGVVTNFKTGDFDSETEFAKIGTGSLGGKARGLAFVGAMLQRNARLLKRFKDIEILVPQTVVITTEGFESFIEVNHLKGLANADLPDAEVAKIFDQARLPDWLAEMLRGYLQQTPYPLAVRSSSILEDAQYRAYAGLYRTYMIPNDCGDTDLRYAQLAHAVKMVYASTYYQEPRSFSRRVGNRTEEERMAVMLQQMIGQRHGSYFYPAISGVAQSHNYYPFDKMKPEEGIATISLGLGKMVVEGERCLRFSPRYPQLLPQGSSVDDLLENAQREFFAMHMEADCTISDTKSDPSLVRRDIIEAADEPPLRMLTSRYVPDEHRIRDTAHGDGYPVLTFAPVLKYDLFPLAPLLAEILQMGQEGMGCPVELEFSVNLCRPSGQRPQMACLQLRPMTARSEMEQINISLAETARAVCVSNNALGNTDRSDLLDVVFVHPDTFDAAHTIEIAAEIASLNAVLLKAGRPYLLIGPGRWGSADRWLGIPVAWNEICGVGAIVEISLPQLKAEPSQGSHFFHNITTLGINYFTVSDKGKDRIDLPWFQSLLPADRTAHVVHLQLPTALRLKVDGRSSRGVILPGDK